jgi:hypothetical protein
LTLFKIKIDYKGILLSSFIFIFIFSLPSFFFYRSAYNREGGEKDGLKKNKKENKEKNTSQT